MLSHYVLHSVTFSISYQVPSTVAPQTRVFTAPKQMKLAEAMAFLGDRGLFWICKTDMTDDYKRAFCSIIKAAATFMQKVPTHDQVEQYHRNFVSSVVELEIMLPLYWNTITLHLLVCRVAEQVLKFGAFHAQNMLHVERLHVLLKNLCRGTCDT